MIKIHNGNMNCSNGALVVRQDLRKVACNLGERNIFVRKNRRLSSNYYYEYQELLKITVLQKKVFYLYLLLWNRGPLKIQNESVIDHWINCIIQFHKPVEYFLKAWYS